MKQYFSLKTFYKINKNKLINKNKKRINKNKFKKINK